MVECAADEEDRARDCVDVVQKVCYFVRAVFVQKGSRAHKATQWQPGNEDLLGSTFLDLLSRRGQRCPERGLLREKRLRKVWRGTEYQALHFRIPTLALIVSGLAGTHAVPNNDEISRGVYGTQGLLSRVVNDPVTAAVMTSFPKCASSVHLYSGEFSLCSR